MLKGFKEFLLRGNVLDLAVAVVVGGAFSMIVAALVKDLLTPLIAALFGQPNFGQLNFTVNNSKFLYGDFINAVVNFVFVAAGIYFFVVLPVKKLGELQARRRAAGEKEDEATPMSDEVVLLGEIRDLLRRRA